MERCLSNAITYHLQTNNLLSSVQHGFRAGSSVVTNLAESTNDWTNIIDSHHNADVVYIDLSKAFDTIVHAKLITKLHSVGVQGSLLCWLINYLSNRNQSTLIDNFLSSQTPVLSGVPQGSVLGPLLFNIFINDLPSFIMIKHNFTFPPLRLFADDIKIYRIVNNLTDALFFQSILDSISMWCSYSQLQINVSKCFILHLGSSNSRFMYGFNGIAIPKTDLIKDLGVYMEPCFSFNRHILIMCSKARARCAIYFKTFVSRDTYAMKLFFITYVRPLLEFASPIWNPILISQINALESVQRNFTNKIPTCSFLPYKRRLEILNLDSLLKRRNIADQVFIFTVLNGSTNSSLYPHLLLANPSVTRGHDLRILRPVFNLASSHQNLISRVCPLWNRLPIAVLASQSKYIFRNKLRILYQDPFKA